MCPIYCPYVVLFLLQATGGHCRPLGSPLSAVNKQQLILTARRRHHCRHHGLYDSPDIIRATESRNVTRAGHLACMEAQRNAFRFLVRKTERIGLLEYPDDIRAGHK